MTRTCRSRDLLLGLFLIVTGILIGLTFNATPSRAQHAGGGAGYVNFNGETWYCQGRDCRSLRFSRLD
jgi:hypothetical protein